VPSTLKQAGPGQTGGAGFVNDTGGFCRTFGQVDIAVTDADVTLTDAQAQSGDIITLITGTYTAGRNVILPTVKGLQFTVANLQLGAFAATFKTAAGTGIAVAQNKTAIIRCDGTNYVRVTADNP
jgi:hypothetical protein